MGSMLAARARNRERNRPALLPVPTVAGNTQPVIAVTLAGAAGAMGMPGAMGMQGVPAPVSMTAPNPMVPVAVAMPAGAAAVPTTVTAPPLVAQPQAKPDIATQLAQLAALRDQGVLTAEQFDGAKKKVLAAM